MRARFFLLSSICLMLPACAQQIAGYNLEGGQYWQRVNASSATYTRGPKAQQMLDQDIASCVVEMRELERLGAIQEPVKTDITGRVLAPNELGQNRHNPDAPAHNGNLYEELAEYSDFDGCMLYKGWERVAWVPYGVGREAQETYLKSNIDYQRQVETQSAQTQRGDFTQMNP